ncbi:unnamed protein product [Pleuronectes platessa]|uniref:Uncharacterized protein n=1 Tax=Pleuronectes platessa TaxID=8262 RepID=A0A9N7TIG8_PLEPL|nr:unnamed protein product [Pleuronectes platessa]
MREHQTTGEGRSQPVGLWVFGVRSSLCCSVCNRSTYIIKSPRRGGVKDSLCGRGGNFCFSDAAGALHIPNGKKGVITLAADLAEGQQKVHLSKTHVNVFKDQ